MKIVVINQSDSVGGAAVASHRLLKALQREGIDARMLVMHASAHRGDSDIVAYGDNLRGKAYFLAERLGIFARNGFSRTNLFKVSTASCGFDLSRHPLVADADAIIINWINQGAMSLRAVEKIASLGKPLLWIMHDMWCCTGICHHAYSCDNYTAQCHACPFLNSAGNDLSTSVQSEKHRIYSASDIRFVAVGSWLEQCCRRSALLRDAHITTIPNAFPVEEYDWHPNAALRKQLCISPDAKVVIMGAARLDDPVKGFPHAIEVLNRFAGRNVHALFVGGIRDASLLDRLQVPYTHTGMLPPSQIADFYRVADIVISTSHYETLGNTLIEGLASGCVPVAFDAGGPRDIIEHKVNGWIAPADDIADFCCGIEWAMEQSTPEKREALHRSASARFDSAVIARRILSQIPRP